MPSDCPKGRKKNTINSACDLSSKVPLIDGQVGKSNQPKILHFGSWKPTVFVFDAQKRHIQRQQLFLQKRLVDRKHR